MAAENEVGRRRPVGAGVGARRRTIGTAGEQYVAQWYAARGGTVLVRNWRCRNGELDLVVRLGSTIVFCEVKTRTGSGFGTGAEAVTPAKQRRIRQLALVWLAQSERRYEEVRFDVASLDAGELTVTEGAF
jgi:putative endonuclease